MLHVAYIVRNGCGYMVEFDVPEIDGVISDDTATDILRKQYGITFDEDVTIYRVSSKSTRGHGYPTDEQLNKDDLRRRPPLPRRD